MCIVSQTTRRGLFIASIVVTILKTFERCLPLLREHAKRDDLLELSIDAGDSARARGAHEVNFMLISGVWELKRLHLAGLTVLHKRSRAFG